MNTKEIVELVKALSDTTTAERADLPFEVGGKYFIRTVTYFATGQVKKIIGKFLVLEDAAWIADTGRFRQAIMDGVLDEIEPVEVDMYLNTDTITDAFVWRHPLPKVQK